MKKIILISLFLLYMMANVSFAKTQLSKPYYKGYYIEYNGEEQFWETECFYNFSEDTMIMTGNSATNAGKYVATIALKDPDNYEWSDGTTDDIEINWEIKKATVTKPYCDDVWCREVVGSGFIEYNGKEQDLVSYKRLLRYYNEDLMTITGNKATNVGAYKATVSLKDTDNYEWYGNSGQGGGTDPITIDWEIYKISVKISGGTARYNGKYQEPCINYFNSARMEIVSGDNQKERGTYKVIVRLKNKDVLEWRIEDKYGDYTYTDEDQEVEWTITYNDCLVPYSRDTIPYNGTEQEANLRNYNSSIMNVVGNKATDVGIYTATVSLKDKENYRWIIYDELLEEDFYVTEDQEINWEIVRASIGAYNDRALEFAYNGEEQNVLSDWYLNWYLEHIDAEIEIEGVTKATNVGNYQFTLKLKHPASYNWSKYDSETGQYVYTDEDQVIKWQIVGSPINLADISQNNTLKYDGREKTPTFKNLDENLIEIKGTNKATNVGTYTATLSLKDKTTYVWKVGNSYTTEDQEIEWTIQKGEIKSWLDEYPRYYQYDDGYEVGPGESYYFSREEDVIITGEMSATEIGTYHATFSLKDKDNYQWVIYNEAGEKIYTTEDQSFTWQIVDSISGYLEEIVQGKIYVLLSDYKSYEYDGQTRKYKLSYVKIAFNNGVWETEEIDARKVCNLESTDSAVKPGTYKAVVSLNNPSKYCFGEVNWDEDDNPYYEDRGTNKLDITWQIRKMSSPEIYVDPDKTSIEYTGKAITVSVETFGNANDGSRYSNKYFYDEYVKPGYVSISGNKGTKVGTYKLTVKIAKTDLVEPIRLYTKTNGRYKFSEESNTINISWSIYKKIQPLSVKLSYNGQDLDNGEVTEVSDKAKLTITATTSSGIKKVYYQVGSEKQKSSTKASNSITLDTKYTNKGILTIKVKAEAKDGATTDWVTYRVEPIKIYVPPTINVSYGDCNIASGDTITQIDDKAKININVSHPSGIKKVYYQIGSEKQKSSTKASNSVTLDTKYTNKGILTIKVKVEAKDGATTDWINYRINPVK